MTRHLLRLVWNRKRQNLLLSVEILCAFFVLFAVVLLGVHTWTNARQPLGFDGTGVWLVSMDSGRPGRDAEAKERDRQTLLQLRSALADMPQVLSHAAVWTSAYSNASWETFVELVDGRSLDYASNRATDELRDVLQIEMTAGRWFSREDDGVAWEPVVINERMARAVFGDAPAAGRTIPEKPIPAGTPRGPFDRPQREMRVVGVMRDFRQHGEYSTPGHYLFTRTNLQVPNPEADLPGVFLLRMRPGTTAAFEGPLGERLRQVAGTWTFEVKDLQQVREEKLSQYTLPLTVVSVIAGFLLLMVALGLTGVVWQSVTQRTREFGLRRAKGAAAPDVQRQVLVELALMTSLAIAVGVLLIVQLPLLPLPRDLQLIDGPVFVGSIVLSAAAIYLVTMLCGLYPSRLATRVPPAEALHYE